MDRVRFRNGSDVLVPFRVVVAYDDVGLTPRQVEAHHDLLSLGMQIDCTLDLEVRTATFTGRATRLVVTHLMALAQGHDLARFAESCWTRHDRPGPPARTKRVTPG